jgi:hypothetical protein
MCKEVHVWLIDWVTGESRFTFACSPCVIVVCLVDKVRDAKDEVHSVYSRGVSECALDLRESFVAPTAVDGLGPVAHHLFAHKRQPKHTHSSASAH